jgi:hypothetical protein
MPFWRGRRCGVDYVDVDTLAVAGTNVGGDSDEGVWIGCVTYAFFGRVLANGRANLISLDNPVDMGPLRSVTIQFRAPRLAGHPNKNRRQRHEAPA